MVFDLVKGKQTFVLLSLIFLFLQHLQYNSLLIAMVDIPCQITSICLLLQYSISVKCFCRTYFASGSVGALLDKSSPPDIQTAAYQPAISTNYVPSLNAYVAIYKVKQLQIYIMEINIVQYVYCYVQCAYMHSWAPCPLSPLSPVIR